MVTKPDSKLGSMEGLPALPRHGVVETAKRSARTTASLEDSGLDLREALSTTVASSTKILAETTRSIRSPHNLTITATSVPMSPRPPSPAVKKSTEFLRVTKAEMERKEQTINSLRADNQQLQGRLRSLETLEQSYKELQAVCTELGQMIGCNMEGVAASSIKIILCDKISKLLSGHTRVTQQLRLCQADAEKSAGEAAAKSAHCSTMESQLTQLNIKLASRDKELQQLKSEIDTLRQSNARSEAVMAKQKQQISELQATSAEQSSGESHSSKLQTELGMVKRQLEKKDVEINSLTDRLAAQKSSLEEAEQRASTAEAVCDNIYMHIGSILRIDIADQDIDSITTKISQVMSECDHLRSKLSEVVHNSEALQMETKANRETILRLVSEAKKHEKASSMVKELQEAQYEREASLVGLKQEKEALQDHLQMAQDSLHSCQQELGSKEQIISALQTSLQRASQAEQSASQQFTEFCSELSAVLGAPSTERASILERSRQLVHRCEEGQKRVYSIQEELSGNSSQLQQFEKQFCNVCTQLESTQQEMEKFKDKNKLLEADTIAAESLNSQLKRASKQYESFVKKLATAIKLDTNMAQILSGEFIYDALLQRAEQLAKQETQVLAEKTSAVYSLQRKLKAARQALESKELHLGLLERKVTTLEERIVSYNEGETHRESTTQKLSKMEKKLEKAQQHSEQQRNVIMQLKSQKCDMDLIKTECLAQQETIAKLSANVEHLTRSKATISAELSATVKQLEKMKSLDKDTKGKLEADIKILQSQYDSLTEKERKLSSFRNTVDRLLSDDTTTSDLSDHELLSILQKLIASNSAHESRARSLETSLKQMEHGFKASYNDTLTLLNYSHES